MPGRDGAIAPGRVRPDLDFVARCADRVAVLRAGAVLAAGAPARVLTSALLSLAFDTAVELERTERGGLIVRPSNGGS